MKTINVDDDLYRYIASQTLHIGESASDILRRLLKVTAHEEAVSQEILAGTVGVVTALVEPLDAVKTIRALLISDEFATYKKAIDRFMLVLSTLYRLDEARFSEAMSIKGRKRVYFADNEQSLLAGGQTTKPKPIPNTPFWVITNTNTPRKRQMVAQVMQRMGFAQELIEKVTLSI